MTHLLVGIANIDSELGLAEFSKGRRITTIYPGDAGWLTTGKHSRGNWEGDLHRN